MGRAATKVRGSRSTDADQRNAPAPGPATTPDTRPDKARSVKAKKAHGGKNGGAKAAKAERKKAGAAQGGKTAREWAPQPTGTPAAATNSVVDAIIAAALGEAVAESLTSSLAESINESFTEMMAGGLAGALEEALVEAVSTAVARDLPGALVTVAAGSLRDTLNDRDTRDTRDTLDDRDAPDHDENGLRAAARGPIPASQPAPTLNREPSAPTPTPTASGQQPRPAVATTAQVSVASDGYAVRLAAARSLWDALPPRRLPVLPGLDLAAQRLAASDPDRIGGDWYDVLALDADVAVLDVGDVAGHGPDKAAQMAQLCHAARAYALLDLPPSQITSGLTEVLRAGGHRSLASICTARLDIPTGRLTWCNAGHPPPVMITQAGEVSFLGDVHGPLLGAAPGTGPAVSLVGGPGRAGGTEYAQSTVTLPVGATVLFYTAGLVDLPDAPIAHRLDALATAASRAFGGASGTASDAAADGDTNARRGGDRPGVDIRPLAAGCDALLAELSTAKAAARGEHDGAPSAPASHRDSDSVLLAVRLR